MRIGELSKKANVPVRTIRYYEEIGLLPTADRTAAGYRTFGGKHLEHLYFIRSAQRLGMKLDQIRSVLRSAAHDSSPCECVREAVQRNIREIDERVAHLQAMRSNLERALSRLDEGDPDRRTTRICPAIESVHPIDCSTRLDSPFDWRV